MVLVMTTHSLYMISGKIETLVRVLAKLQSRKSGSYIH